MSGSRWVITPSWLSGSWRSFLYGSSVYSCHLLLISSASGRSIQFPSFIKPIFAWNVPLVSLTILKPRDYQCISLMKMFILSYANVLCIYPKFCLQIGSASWLRIYLINQYVIFRYCSPNLCKWNYLYGDLPFFKIQVNHFMAQDEPFGAKIIPKCISWVRGLVPFWVLRHSFLSLTDC